MSRKTTHCSPILFIPSICSILVSPPVVLQPQEVEEQGMRESRQEQERELLIERLQEGVVLVEKLREVEGLEERLREVKVLEVRLQEVDELEERIQEVLEEEIGREEGVEIREQQEEVLEQEVEQIGEVVEERLQQKQEVLGEVMKEIVEDKVEDVDELEEKIKEVFLKGLLPEENTLQQEEVIEEEVKEEEEQVEIMQQVLEERWKEEVDEKEVDGLPDVISTTSVFEGCKVEWRTQKTVTIVEEIQEEEQLQPERVSEERLEMKSVVLEWRKSVVVEERFHQMVIREESFQEDKKMELNVQQSLIDDKDNWFVLLDSSPIKAIYNPPGMSTSHHAVTIVTINKTPAFPLPKHWPTFPF